MLHKVCFTVGAIFCASVLLLTGCNTQQIVGENKESTTAIVSDEGATRSPASFYCGVNGYVTFKSGTRVTFYLDGNVKSGIVWATTILKKVGGQTVIVQANSLVNFNSSGYLN
jgi:predicted small secreted protein